MKITPLKKNVIIKAYEREEKPTAYKLYGIREENKYFQVVTVGAECTGNINPGDIIMINPLTAIKLDDEEFKGLYIANSEYVDAIVKED